MVSLESSDKHPHSAPTVLANSPHSTSSLPTSDPVDLAVLFHRLCELSLQHHCLPSYFSSFFSSLPQPPKLPHDLALDTSCSGPDLISSVPQFEMYHLPLPLDARRQYQMQMANYHQRQLDEVLAPGECPIGSDAETCFRAHRAVVLIENVSLPHALHLLSLVLPLTSNSLSGADSLHHHPSRGDPVLRKSASAGFRLACPHHHGPFLGQDQRVLCRVRYRCRC